MSFTGYFHANHYNTGVTESVSDTCENHKMANAVMGNRGLIDRKKRTVLVITSLIMMIIFFVLISSII